MSSSSWFLHLLALLVITGCALSSPPSEAGDEAFTSTRADAVQKTDSEWRSELTDSEFRILRNKGTERPFTGKYWDANEKGVYHCAGCALPLFSSETKFKSGTGWPSFTDVVGEAHVAEKQDKTLGMMRTEILCNRCGGHLGHVFNDGPKPTGLRYCVNGTALDFMAEDSETSSMPTTP